MNSDPPPTEHRFWRHSPQQAAETLACGLNGLCEAEATERLEHYGPNSDAPSHVVGPLRTVLRRLLEPLSLILLVAGSSRW